MALAVFFLLCGLLAAELALFGLQAAAYIGACCFVLAAVVLALGHRRHDQLTA